MKRLVLAVVVLLLLLEGCSKPEAPASHASSEPAQQPVQPPPIQLSPEAQANVAPDVPAPVATDQAAAAIHAQAEQLMLMQLMQMQQQMVTQNINRLGEIGADASEKIYQQGIVNGCYLQGNCAVRTITVPAR